MTGKQNGSAGQDTAKRGSAVEYVKPYSLRHTEFFICALILFVSVFFVHKSWSSPMCSIEISVSEFSTNDRPQYFGASVSEAYIDLDKDNPFFIFAKDAEADLLEAVSNNLCSQVSSNAPISVELMFVRLEMAASELEIENLRTELAGINGSYADVTVDQAGRAIKAKIIWNPRRILRDQLALDGYKFSEDTPLLPFLDFAFRKYIGTYSTQVVHAPSREKAHLRAAEFKGTVPDDMYGLIVRSNRGTRIPFGGFVSGTIYSLIQASRPGYTAMTNAAIKRAFKSGHPEPLNSVLDIQSTNIRSLYRQSEWISRVWIGRIQPFEPKENYGDRKLR